MAAVRFWGEAIANEPRIAEDRQTRHRYNGSCSAALAGCGQGNDDPKPDTAARVKLREQALAWLTAEREAWAKFATAADAQVKQTIAATLRHWKQDTDLAGIRDADGLAKLPVAEREKWKAFWADVDTLLKSVEAK